MCDPTIPIYIQVTQLVKHLPVGRQHAIAENVGRLLKKWILGEYVSGKCSFAIISNRDGDCHDRVIFLHSKLTFSWYTAASRLVLAPS